MNNCTQTCTVCVCVCVCVLVLNHRLVGHINARSEEADAAPRPTLKNEIFVHTITHKTDAQKTDKTDRQEKLWRRMQLPAPRSAKRYLWCAAGHVLLLKVFAWYVCLCVCV